LTSPYNSCIKNETRVREAEGIFLIEVPDNVRKIVIVKAQVHEVMKKSLYAYLSIFTAAGCFRQDWLCVSLYKYN
jgi:hypothetical protein